MTLSIFGNVPDPLVTVIIYALYIIVPAMFYLPSFLFQKIKLARKVAIKD